MSFAKLLPCLPGISISSDGSEGFKEKGPVSILRWGPSVCKMVRFITKSGPRSHVRRIELSQNGYLSLNDRVKFLPIFTYIMHTEYFIMHLLQIFLIMLLLCLKFIDTTQKNLF